MNRLLKFLHFGNISSVTFASGFTMLLTLALTYCIAAGGLVIGLSVSRFIVAISFLVSEALVYINTSKKCFYWSTCINVVCWIVALPICGHIYDYSWDGIAYHQQTIWALANDWNPIWDDAYGEWMSLWSIHYAKGLELISACIFKFTGDFEAGKAVNILLAVASFLITLDCVKILKPDISKCNRIIFAIIVVSNPVWICQLLTYYIDYAEYFYLLLTIEFSVYICHCRNVSLSYIGLTGVIFLAIGTKFNHFFMEGIVIIAIIGWLIISGNRNTARIFFKVSLISAIIGVGIFAFHPYFTNWLYQGNPFYPLMGEDAIDIMTSNTPPLFLNNNRFENWVSSVYGRVAVPMYDSRVSGYGPVFQVLFSICLCCIIFSEIKRKRVSVVSYASVWILGSCLFFEQSWWARYNPQLWFIVPLAYFVALNFNTKTGFLMRCPIGTIALINIVLSSVFATIDGLRTTAYRDSLYEVLKGKEVIAHVDEKWKQRLKYYGMSPIVVDENVIPEEERVPILHIPEFHVKNYWLQVDSIDKAKVDSLYENHDYCVYRKTLWGKSKRIYQTIEQKLKWK